MPSDLPITSITTAGSFGYGKNSISLLQIPIPSANKPSARLGPSLKSLPKIQSPSVSAIFIAAKFLQVDRPRFSFFFSSALGSCHQS